MDIGTRNQSIFCVDESYKRTATNIWSQGIPFSFKSPTFLLMFQLSSVSTVSLLIDVCFKPLGQSSLVSQIFGGMVFGPSIFGQTKCIEDTVFPKRSRLLMDVFSDFGIMFFFFVIGVKMDVSLMVRPGRLAAVIGASALIITIALSIALAIVLKMSMTMNATLDKSLLIIAASQSMTAFPVISTLLDELKILNTDVGRLALSSSMFCYVIWMSLVLIASTIKAATSHHVYGSVLPLLSTLSFVASNFLLIRPMLKKMFPQTMGPNSVDEKSIAFIFILVMVSAFVSEVIGQHYIFGPLVLGLAVPDGPPLGAAISSKLDSLGLAFFYPAYCAVSGLQTNVFDVDSQSFLIVGIIVFFAFVVKLIAVMLPALCFDLPLKDAFVLGLILNARGIVELSFFNVWKEYQLLVGQEYTLVMVSVVIVTAIITPLIRILYHPSKQHVSGKRSTIHYSSDDLEFRILVCIHKHENLPTMMNILEATHASEKRPVAVTAMALVELVGRSTPTLTSNQPHLQRTSSTPDQILNSLMQYESRNEGCTTVQSYTSIAHFQTMHYDICRIAFDKRAHIVILPFHKQWGISGKFESSSHPIKNLNLNVLNKAPCSVGILIDRGTLTGSVSFQTSTSKFHVAVIFLSGPDDVESLAYGCRMVKHERVHLTIIRLLVSGDENVKDIKCDNNVINEYRQTNVGNDRLVYEEKVLEDGLELSSYISASLEPYDLVLVGKDHSYSPLLQGLGDWNECPEIGFIGDMLASPDLRTKASVLVIQQHKVGAKQFNKSLGFLVCNDGADYPEFDRTMSCQGNKTDSYSISIHESNRSR